MTTVPGTRLDGVQLGLAAASSWPVIADDHAPPPDPLVGLVDGGPATRGQVLGDIVAAVEDGLPCPVAISVVGSRAELRMATNAPDEVDAWGARFGFVARVDAEVSSRVSRVRMWRGQVERSPWVGWPLLVFCMLDDSRLVPAEPYRPVGGALAALMVPARPATPAALLEAAYRVTSRLGWSPRDTGGVSIAGAMRTALVGDPILGQLADADRSTFRAATAIVAHLLLVEDIDGWQHAAGRTREQVLAVLAAAQVVAEQLGAARPNEGPFEQLFAAARMTLPAVSS